MGHPVSNVPFLASPGGHHFLYITTVSSQIPCDCDKMQTSLRAVSSGHLRPGQHTPVQTADYTQTQTQDKTQLTRNTIAHYYTLDRGINIIIP